MKKLLLGSVAFAALIAGPAMAADLGVRPVYKSPVVAPVIGWTGFYVGVNGGYAWNAGTQNHDATITSDFPDIGDLAVTTPGQTTLNPRGGCGGVQFGYNWQMGNVVFGLEPDFQAAAIKASNDLNV